MVIGDISGIIKMWSRSNWCERTILLSSISLVLILLLNATLQRIYLSLWLTFYALILIVSFVWISCIKIRILLLQNGPSKNATEKFSNKYFAWKYILPIFPKLNCILISDNKRGKDKLQIEDDFAISKMISSVIERKYIWSWYSQYVSKEVAFPFGCKELLDQMVLKIFQASSNLDMIRLSSDSLTIVLRHSKEYKKASKRFEKFNKGDVQDYYKYSHPTSNHKSVIKATQKEKSSQNHCLVLTRAMLKELLPWELWDTPHAMLLSSILAKRLDNFVNNCLSDPKWLRRRIEQLICTTEKPDIILNPAKAHNSNIVSKYDTEKIEKSEVHDIKQESNTPTLKPSVESALSSMMSKSLISLPKIESKDQSNQLSVVIPSIYESKPKNVSQPINIESKTPQNGFGTPFNAKNANEVKIYDRVVEGAVKTWNTDVDLECVSMGHDLLASLDGEMGFKSRLGRLWESDASDSNEIWSLNPQSANAAVKTPQTLWFGEEDNIDMELSEESPPKNAHHPHFNISKPLSMQNMKELQNLSKNTVNQAKHKMGDFQDEAAGVMEGILDRGLAGFKKLRLPGLQDTQDAQKVVKGTNQTNNLVATVGQVLSISRKNSQSEETLKHDQQFFEKDENKSAHASPSPHLPRQQNIDISSIDIKESIKISPVDIFDEDSPDYEYEEAENLSSTIAKLRCLLQQKSENVAVTAEDALLTDNIRKKQEDHSSTHREFTDHHLSSVESESEFTMISPNISNSLEAEDVLNHKSFNPAAQENNIQRLDKLFTRTVTGVFNTIKTAVGGDTVSEALINSTENNGVVVEGQNSLKPSPSGNWTFVEGEEDLSVLIGRLLVERRGYCVVEAAQDSLDMINTFRIPSEVNIQEDPTNPIQDELDESDLVKKCPLWQMCVELISVTLGGVMQKDAVVKSINVTFGETGEKILEEKLTQLSVDLRKLIINEFLIMSKTQETNLTNESPQEYPDTELKELCQIISDKIPSTFVNLFGKEEISDALQMLMSSIDHKTINRDIVFSLLDIFIHHFLKACSSRPPVATPPPSA